MGRAVTVTECDVLVCGGGMAGTMAAIAAGRAGARTLLLERNGFLGGNATAGAVGQFNCWQTASGRRVIGGLAVELVERLERIGGSGGHSTWTMSTGHRMDRVEYSPDILKIVLDAMATEAGVKILFHTVLDNAVLDERSVTAVNMLTKNGRHQIKAGVIIDASGDIEVLQRAGGKIQRLNQGERLQPATMMFRFGPIDFERFQSISTQDLARLAQEGVKKGLLARAALHASRVPFSDDGWFNISRLVIDASDAFALSEGEIEGRRQAWSAAQYLAMAVPGCEAGRLVAFAQQIGVRETRRVEGDYVLTADDLRRGVLFPDAIAMGAYPIDIHPAESTDLHYEEFGADHSYSIPYRSLIPVSFDNTLVAGRAISATHEANGAIRVMPTAMAIGQAAGTAAAMVSGTGSRQVRAVDIATFQETLRKNGAILPA